MANPVFYSISPYGTGDIKTGSPNITISGGVATLSVAQTGNIGCGCAIEFGSSVVYIAPNRIGFDAGSTEIEIGDKIEGATSGATGIVRFVQVTSGDWSTSDAAGWIYFEQTNGTFQDNESINRTKPTSASSIATIDGVLQGNIGSGNTEFVVLTATGGTPSDQSSISVTYIHHEYASLADWEAGFTDSNHINNTSLVTADVCAFACCYYDHDDYTADTQATTISGTTTSSTNNIYILTPNGVDETVASQRHSGVWTNNKQRHEVTVSGSGQANIIVEDSYVIIDGLQMSVNADFSSNDCIRVSTTNNINLKVANCLLKARSAGANYIAGICFEATGELKVFNVCAYDFNYEWNDFSAGILLYGQSGGCNVYISNTTVYNCWSGVASQGGSITIVAKNTLTQECNDGFYGTFDSTSDYNCSDVSGDAPGTHSITGTVTFVDASNDNFHLDATDTVARDAGTDLSSDTNLAFWRDIDGEERSGTWDIGADEYVASGGQTGTLQDTFGLSETRQALGKYNASLSDSMGFSEQETGLGAYLRNKSDNLSFSDLRQALAGFLGSNEDAITLSETLTAIGNYQRNATDTFQLSDSLSAFLKGIAALTDIFNLSDIYAGSVISGAFLEDVLSLTENLIASGNYLASNVDTITINDQVVGVGAFVRALTDTYDLSDECSTQLIGVLSDTFTLIDVLGVLGSYIAIKADSITFDDVCGTNISFTATLSDDITLTDATTALASYAVALVDTLGLSDQAEIIVAKGIVTVRFMAKKFSITFTAIEPNTNFEGS